MAQRGDLTLTMQQTMRMTPQQLQFVKMLEMNAPELEEAVARQVEENTALTAELPEEERPREREREPDDSEEDVGGGGYSVGGGAFYLPADNEVSLYDDLNSQLTLTNADPVVVQVARYIIGNLDPNGYLRRSVMQIYDDITIDYGLDITPETVKEALRLVQSLDPAGVGAANMRETLILQLRRLPKSEVRDDALRVLDEFYDEFAMRHTHKIVSGSKLGVQRVKDAIRLIDTLNPKPGGAVQQGVNATAPVVIPDYVVENDNGRLMISLENRLPALRIDESFEEAYRNLKARGGRKSKDAEFVKMNYERASDFIKILTKRQRTLMDIMTAIVRLQQEYFETEDISKMRPMVMRDVAEVTGYDLSVISRATNNKYVSMPWGGVLPLRYFFSDEKGGENSGGITDKEIKVVIKELVEGEDKRHPLSDDAIQKLLESRGYPTKRRTVAKYRDALGIPVARLRKENI